MFNFLIMLYNHPVTENACKIFTIIFIYTQVKNFYAKTPENKKVVKVLLVLAVIGLVYMTNKTQVNTIIEGVRK